MTQIRMTQHNVEALVAEVRRRIAADPTLDVELTIAAVMDDSANGAQFP